MFCGFNFIFIIIHKKISKKSLKFSKFILPNNNLSFISILLLFMSFPDFVNDKFDLNLGKHREIIGMR